MPEDSLRLWPFAFERELLHFQCGVVVALNAVKIYVVPQEVVHEVRRILLRSRESDLQRTLVRLYEHDQVDAVELARVLQRAMDALFPAPLPEGYRR